MSTAEMTSSPMNATMKTLRFHSYGEAAEVLTLEDATIPEPGPGHIRVRVQACGLNPADWALCQGLFAGSLPRGIGLEVSGQVDALGDGVTDVVIGDQVFGPANFADYASAGASEYAIVYDWARVPPELDLIEAAALPMAVETAYRSLNQIGLAEGQTILIHGAGTTVGFAAVQMAISRGARVIATAGETFAGQLRGFGATVTSYGEGMVERVREIAGGAPDLILDCAPPRGVLPALIKVAGGDPRRVLTITDFAEARALGVRSGLDEDATMENVGLRYDVLGEYAQLAATGRFTVPVARTFALNEWREALALSQGGNPHGKLVLLPNPAAKN